MYIIIAGGGKVGSFLAKDLSRRGHTIALIERREDRAARIASELPDVFVIRGDACDADYLEDAGIERADAVIAVTGDDDDNLVISQLAKEVYHIQKVIARVNNPKNEKIFEVLGVGVPVSATSIIGKIVEEEVSVDEILTVLPLKQGKFAVVETRIPENSSVSGRRVSDLGFPRDCILIAIDREDELIIPRGSTVLKGGDTVFAITVPEKEQVFIDCLKGKHLGESCEL